MEPGRPPTPTPGRERQRRRPEGLPRPALGDTARTARERAGTESARTPAARKAEGSELTAGHRPGADPPASVFVTVSMEISRRGRREQLRAPLRPSSTAGCWRPLFSRPGRRCRSPGRWRRPPTPPLCALSPPRRRPSSSSSLQSSPQPLLRLLPLLRPPPRSRVRTPSVLGARRVCIITLRRRGERWAKEGRVGRARALGRGALWEI